MHQTVIAVIHRYNPFHRLYDLINNRIKSYFSITVKADLEPIYLEKRLKPQKTHLDKNSQRV